MWGGDKKRELYSKLTNPPFKAIVKLDIVWANVAQRVIVATDIFPKAEPTVSYKEWAIRSRNSEAMQNTLVHNMASREMSSSFYPRPLSKLTMDEYEKKTAQLLQIVATSKPETGNYREWEFTKIYSPLEIEFVGVQESNCDMKLILTSDSFNLRPMDARLRGK